MNDIFTLTADFAKYIVDIPKPVSPERLSEQRKIWTSSALAEELQEFKDAETLEDEVDALMDLMYFAAGRFYEMGVNGKQVLNEVHKANMLKEKGELSKRPGALGCDAIKPYGWKAPDIKKAIERRPKILVIGHGRHGKDTVCDILQNSYGLKFTSSSAFCAERIMRPYFEKLGRKYNSTAECFEDRHSGNNRQIWYKAIQEYNFPIKSKLAKEILKENDIYCGMRDSSELVQCIKENVFDAIIWVDRSKVILPEDQGSCSVTPHMADYHLDNNSDISTTVQNLGRIMNHLYWKV
jgi:dephospho-CoA kinase